MHIQLEIIIKIRQLSKQVVARFDSVRRPIGLWYSALQGLADNARSLVHVIAWIHNGRVVHKIGRAHVW
jgi:hypothetical protein